jgi:hypothetical protein
MYGNSGRIGTFPGKWPSSSPPPPPLPLPLPLTPPLPPPPPPLILGDNFISESFEWFGLRKACNKKLQYSESFMSVVPRNGNLNSCTTNLTMTIIKRLLKQQA